jgi:hypothetical protein
MKVYLDDERTTPDSWVRTYTPEETIALLVTGDVTHLSLDHDLALGDGPTGRERTGYDVLLWIEEQVALHGFNPPEMVVHSANSSARDKMNRAIEAINRRAQS